MADIELVIKIPESSYKAACNGCMLPPDVENVVQGIKDGILFREKCDRENSEIMKEVKDLSKRLEALENQMKEDKEAQLKKIMDVIFMDKEEIRLQKRSLDWKERVRV